MKFCNDCASPLTLKIPEGDTRPRYTCSGCFKIHYENPKIIAGTLPIFEEKILLCKRGIHPQLNKWTLPAGFLETQRNHRRGRLKRNFRGGLRFA